MQRASKVHSESKNRKLGVGFIITLANVNWFTKDSEDTCYGSSLPPFLECVATLPCEIWRFKNASKFDIIYSV